MQIWSDEVKKDVYRLQPVLSVGVMGEPTLCRYLTKDKPGKPSKVQLAMYSFFGVVGRAFCEDCLRPCWVKDVEKANAHFCR